MVVERGQGYRTLREAPPASVMMGRGDVGVHHPGLPPHPPLQEEALIPTAAGSVWLLTAQS